jgi:hypothetical protein
MATPGGGSWLALLLAVATRLLLTITAKTLVTAVTALLLVTTTGTLAVATALIAAATTATLVPGVGLASASPSCRSWSLVRDVGRLGPMSVTAGLGLAMHSAVELPVPDCPVGLHDEGALEEM